MAKVPVIIHESLKSRGIDEHLAKFPQLIIRYSTSTLQGCCIFPTSSIAFLLLGSKEMQFEDCTKRIQSFIEVHRKSFVVCCINPLVDDTTSFILSLQTKFLTTSYQLLVTCDWGEAADAIVSAANSHSPAAIGHIKNSVKKFIEDSMVEDAVSAILASIGLNAQECALLLDGCGSLSSLASKTTEQFLEFGLDEITADRLVNYFQRDCYSSST